MPYSHQDIEKKWQKKWSSEKAFEAQIDKNKEKFYGLSMFPYPSGDGLHMGHLANYVPLDVLCRFKRAKGFNVLQPIGYDAFGLPAEQFAIKTGTHPEVSTDKAISNFRNQLQSVGISFDWSREISTCKPDFYKWTQFIFTKLHEKGLAYQTEALVNWCPELKTVLANEEIVDGKSERGGHPVMRVPMKQWVLKITAYADRLLEDLDKVNWPDQTKQMQANWIGKSIGASVDFECGSEKLKVFTTRPDTLWGATFLCLAPEHPLAVKICSDENKDTVENYVTLSKSKSELSRKQGKEKTGVFTGAYAINPVNSQKVPVWVADYVLMDYGSGAIMCVPAHDERDFEFAKAFEIPIKSILKEAPESKLPFSGNGTYIESDFINGLSCQNEAIDKVVAFLESKKIGQKQINYKLRDWLFSRQRYWGEPLPIIHYGKNEASCVDVSELPVELPETKNFQPTEDGKPPLASIDEFMNYTNKEGKTGLREANTMPGSAGSSWYFLRYLDPKNSKEPFSFEAQDYWMPVDVYMGGTEHAVGHLLYARFWQKVLFDCGLVSHDEPFGSLKHQGVVMGEDGVRMSKSRGNIINPDEIIKTHGADACRFYILFAGPFEKEKHLNLKGPSSSKKFLDKILALSQKTKDVEDKDIPADLLKLSHQTIKKVSEDLEKIQVNTAISALMIFTNRLSKEGFCPKSLMKVLVQMLMPIAPHISEEIWESLGQKGLISLEPWPSYNEQLAKQDEIEIGVQINGKTRGSIKLSSGASEDQAMALAKGVPSILKHLENKEIVKSIYREGKIFNLIVK